MRKKKQEPKEMAVYVLISQDGTTCYVGKTARGNEYNAYKEHVRFHKKETAEFFKAAEKSRCYPEMYLLTTVTATQEWAFRYCIAWTRYFLEHGISSLAYPMTQAYAWDLLPETEELYNEIKDMPLETVLDEANVLVASYKKKDKNAPRTPKNEIKISVSHEEYEKIRLAAEKQNMSMSRYSKNMVLEGRIMTLEPPEIFEYMAEVRGAKVILRQILYAIYVNGKYYPADLENIQNMVDRICEMETMVHNAYGENTKALYRLLPK